MLWVKFGSVVVIVLIAILATLGGREFFESFDVNINRKNVAETQSSPSDKNSSVIEKSKNSSNQTEDNAKKDGEWAEFH